MAVLQMLSKYQGEPVTRAQLLESIWPGGDVYDEALTQSVYQLRQHLFSAGGDEQHRNLISTVPKRGYVLNVEVRPLVDRKTEPGVWHSSSRHKRYLAAAIVVFLAIAAWGLHRGLNGTDTVLPLAETRTIAVLPFLPLVDTEREPVLELGMAETLITRLSGIQQLVVRPISSVRRYGDMNRDTLDAGRRLGVDAVLDGSVHHSGDTLRVAVRLLRVPDGAALWAETIDVPFGSIFSVQDEICQRIATALAVELRQDERYAMVRGGTSNTQAYQKYMQGRYHLARFTPTDLLQSVSHFREAVALDPNYTQAWLGLASVQFQIPLAGEVPPREHFPLARQAAEKALELDPDSAEGYAMLGRIEHWFEWDWAAAEAHFKRAIALNPNDSESHLGFAHLLASTGRFEQAIEEVRRARELSPLYPVAAALEGGFLLWAGRVEEALQRLEEARPVGDGFWLFHITLSGAYSASGKPEEALLEMRRASEVSGGSTWVMANEIGLLMRMGQSLEAQALFESLLQRSEGTYVPAYNLAVAYRAMGDFDSAMAMLLQAFESRDPKLTLMGIGGWPSLRERPEYQDLLQRLNLQVAME